ncbi:MAG: ISL3 family transposase [Gemmataceae bacterium]
MFLQRARLVSRPFSHLDFRFSAVADITIQLDLPESTELLEYQSLPEGHGFFVRWNVPQRVCCPKCHHSQDVILEYQNKISAIRDLDIWGQPSFFLYQGLFHRCRWCRYRQFFQPPFKRKNVSYTNRFEQHVLRMLIGSCEEDVARCLGISAETVGWIVQNLITDSKDKKIDPQRVIQDIGIDEISLKKRHKLYVTILTDLTDPDQPRVLAMASGRDEQAASQCLEKLSSSQRAGVGSYRADMAQAYHNACRNLLPNARGVVDRFHVAKNFNEAVDKERQRITREYKAQLSQPERRQFRSLMWLFRRRRADLSRSEKAQLAELLQKLPELKRLYNFKERFPNIFDSSSDRNQAGRRLSRLLAQISSWFAGMDKFLGTFEKWYENILNYFDSGQSSGPVEGINDKVRVIIKRSYGLKKAESLWTRLILDLNRGAEAILWRIDQIRQIKDRFRAIFTTVLGT